MQDIYAYNIKLKGQVDEDDLNTMGPLELTIVRVNEGVATIRTTTDQAGLIGLLRFLHGQGYVLLSITRDP